MKRKAFSMIEVLFAMTIMSMLLSIAVPSQMFQIIAEKKVAFKEDIELYKNLTKKMQAAGYKAQNFTFTSTAKDKVYELPAETLTYSYALSHANTTITQKRTFDEQTSEYSSFGIILDSNGTLEPSCYVQNLASDSKPYWTNKCTPEELEWN